MSYVTRDPLKQKNNFDRMETKFARNRAQLAPNCPCGKSNKDGKFAPDKNDPEKGFCHSCSKFFDSENNEFVQPISKPTKPTEYHPSDLMRKSFKNDNNNFYLFLNSMFPLDKVEQQTKLYNLGSAKVWKGATVFWQVDNLGRVRYGKVMLYDQATCKRVKEPFNHFTNIHSILKLENFNYKQCLFGLHLINDNTKPVAIVESEKTALIMSIVDDSYLWLATGGKGNFNYEFLEPIKGKEITAFPDAGEEIWTTTAERLNQTGFNISISDVLKDKPKGTDLADIVIDEVLLPEQKVIEEPETIKHGIGQNLQVTELERIKIGLQFSTEELTKLARKLIPEQDSRTAKELLQMLNEFEGLEKQDATDLILTMRIKDIIDKTSIGTYYLSTSTPY